MPLVSEFNYARIKQLQIEFTKILEHLSEEVNKLEISSNRFKGLLNDKTSVEALKIINEYKKIIKKMNEQVSESLKAVRLASDKFAYIEDGLASQLSKRG